MQKKHESYVNSRKGRGQDKIYLQGLKGAFHSDKRANRSKRHKNINVYRPQHGASNYMNEKLPGPKWETEKSTFIIGNVNIPPQQQIEQVECKSVICIMQM